MIIHINDNYYLNVCFRQILNIPGRKRIDVQLFSVIAALSEKVAQVEYV